MAVHQNRGLRPRLVINGTLDEYFSGPLSSLPMSSSESGATWLSLLDEKKHDIKECFGQDHSVLGDISNGRSFRSALEKFSKKRGEYRVSRLEAKLLPSFTPITDLARAVGQSTADLQHLAPNETLEGLVWWISFATIEVSDLTPKAFITDHSIDRVQSWSSSNSPRKPDS